MNQSNKNETAAPARTLTLRKETVRAARIQSGVKAGAVPRTNAADCRNSVVRCQGL